MAPLPPSSVSPLRRVLSAPAALVLLVAPAWTSCGDTGIEAAGGSSPSRAPRPDVIVIAFDGLGPDHVASLGPVPSLAVTPGLDRLVDEAAVYVDAYAPSPWPDEALAAALTGLMLPGDPATSESAPTLAEHLSHLGYRTALWAGHDQHLLQRSSDGHRGVAGFARVESVDGADTAAGARADEVARAAIEWLLDDAGPALLVVTLADPRPPHHLYAGLVPAADVPYDGQVLAGLDHAELLRRAPSFDAEDRARLAELHASEVAMADRAFVQITEAAAERRGLAPVIVAIGLRAPALGPPRYGLVPSTDPNDLRVPMVIRFPSTPSAAVTGEVDVPVSLVDLTPTLLDALGFEPRRDIDGCSVLPGARLPQRSLVAVTTRGIRSAALIGDDRAVHMSLDGSAVRRLARAGRDAEPAPEPAPEPAVDATGPWRETDSRSRGLDAILIEWLDGSGLLTDAERDALSGRPARAGGR